MNLIIPLNEVTSVMKQSFDTKEYLLFWCEDMHNGMSDYRKAFLWDMGTQRFSAMGGKPIAETHQYFIVFDVECRY